MSAVGKHFDWWVKFDRGAGAGADGLATRLIGGKKNDIHRKYIHDL